MGKAGEGGARGAFRHRSTEGAFGAYPAWGGEDAVGVVVVIVVLVVVGAFEFEGSVGIGLRGPQGFVLRSNKRSGGGRRGVERQEGVIRGTKRRRDREMMGIIFPIMMRRGKKRSQSLSPQRNLRPRIPKQTIPRPFHSFPTR